FAITPERNGTTLDPPCRSVMIEPNETISGGRQMTAGITRVSRSIVRRRTMVQGAGGLAGILALGKAPAIAQTKPTKLVIAHITPVPESGAVALDWFAKAMTERSHGDLQVEFHGGTLLTKEIDVM